MGLDKKRSLGYVKVMLEILEHLISQEAQHPQQFRKALYRELLSSEVYLLTLGEPIEDGLSTLRKSTDFLLWAEQKAPGEFRVPVFPSSDSVASFISSHHLKAPAGKEFLWMSQNPQKALAPLLELNGFLGLNLYLAENESVAVSQEETKLLAKGIIPCNA